MNSVKGKKVPLLLGLFLVAGQYLINYIDKKHDEQLRDIESFKTEIKEDLRQDRTDLKESLQDIKRSVQITESRVFELYRDQARHSRRETAYKTPGY